MKLALLVLSFVAGCGDPPPVPEFDGPALVYFTLGESCPYCTRIAADLADLENLHGDRWAFRIEPAATSASKAAMKRFGIRQGHGLVALDADGNVSARIEGHDIRRSQLEELLR
ncbi:MAG: hypothetical protein ACYTGN_00495 [Planctomycetota bacterium]